MRLAVVAALLCLFVLARALHARRMSALQGPAGGPGPRLPAGLLGDGPRTWLVFTTPWCASCEPAAERLRTADPEARVAIVDATRERALADAFSVRSAPTALLADGDGEVRARLVGAAAVDRYLRSPQ